MKRIILVKHGELALKGLNKKNFEALLIKNIKRVIGKYGSFNIYSAQSTTVIEPQGDVDFESCTDALKKVFGIAAFSTALVCEKDMKDIFEKSRGYLKDYLSGAKTFKVDAKRSDKKFPLTSPEIAAEMGAFILSEFPYLKVDVHNPDVTVTVEIRDFNAFVRTYYIKGAGGMPTGSNGRGSLLLSGGIDSPVAGYMIAKRGVEIDAVHFFSYPYTGEKAKEKVIELADILSGYTGRLNLHIVPFTEIQEEIRDKCPEEYFTLIMRRFMMRIAEKIAVKNGSSCLITGESIGQVASQTMGSLMVTDSVVSMPVFRPVIGMDKDEIVLIARKIGTFDTSVLPYEDCCTVFTPKHPKTNPKLSSVIEAEAVLNIEELENKAIMNTEVIRLPKKGIFE